MSSSTHSLPTPGDQTGTRKAAAPYQQIDLTKFYSDHLSGLGPGSGLQIRGDERMYSQYPMIMASPKFYEPNQGWLAAPEDLKKLSCLA